MDVNVTPCGEVYITTAETTVNIDLEDVLNEVSVETLIDALDCNGTDWVGTLVELRGAEAVLEEVGEEDLKKYIAENGLGSVDPVLDDFGTQELIDELNTRDSIHEILDCVDSHIIQYYMEARRGDFSEAVDALRVLWEFFQDMPAETGRKLIIE